MKKLLIILALAACKKTDTAKPTTLQPVKVDCALVVNNTTPWIAGARFKHGTSYRMEVSGFIPSSLSNWSEVKFSGGQNYYFPVYDLQFKDSLGKTYYAGQIYFQSQAHYNATLGRVLEYIEIEGNRMMIRSQDWNTLASYGHCIQ